MHSTLQSGHRKYQVRVVMKLENQLPPIEDRGQTDRITVLASPSPNANLDLDLDFQWGTKVCRYSRHSSGFSWAGNF